MEESLCTPLLVLLNALLDPKAQWDIETQLFCDKYCVISCHILDMELQVL